MSELHIGGVGLWFRLSVTSEERVHVLHKADMH